METAAVREEIQTRRRGKEKRLERRPQMSSA